MIQIPELKAADFGRHASPGSLFLSNEGGIEKLPALLPYAHYLRQAWSELKLSGVLCVDDRPTVYLCEGTRFADDEVKTLLQPTVGKPW